MKKRKKRNVGTCSNLLIELPSSREACGLLLPLKVIFFGVPSSILTSLSFLGDTCRVFFRDMGSTIILLSFFYFFSFSSPLDSAIWFVSSCFIAFHFSFINFSPSCSDFFENEKFNQFSAQLSANSMIWCFLTMWEGHNNWGN